MNLGFLFQISGVHYGGWRHPGAQPERATDIGYYADIVRTAERLPEAKGSQSRQEVIVNLARRENLTIRQLYQRISGASGHRSLRGTPTQIADQFEEWVSEDAADGFNILSPYLPDSMNDFVDLVVPDLQRRGLFRTEYEGSSLRDHLGLSRPHNSVAKIS